MTTQPCRPLAILTVFWAVAALLMPGWAGADDRPASLTGPAKVLDGRTLDVRGRAVRIAGIDVPEPEQTCRWSGRTIPCGAIAGDALRDLITGATVDCRIIGGTGELLIGLCAADGFDIGGNMVHTGWALAGADAPQRYRRTETEAQAAGRGLWRGEFVTPADWRAGKRLP